MSRRRIKSQLQYEFTKLLTMQTLTKNSSGRQKEVDGGIVCSDVSAKNDVDTAVNYDVPNVSRVWCGFKWWGPKCCRRLADIRLFVVVIGIISATQSFVNLGLTASVISTIERRYQISSTEAGLIMSCSTIMSLLLTLPISYCGGRGNKPRYLAVGSIISGLGSFTFALPHFLSGRYHVDNSQQTLVCQTASNQTDPCLEEYAEISQSYYIYLFFLGQLIQGAGATPFFILGVSYIDENVSPRLAPLYNGIFFTCTIVGSASGRIVGSKLLAIYVDLDVDPAIYGLSVDNPRWVGAWWLGFVACAPIYFVLFLPMLAFPPRLTGSERFQRQRTSEVCRSKYSGRTGASLGLKDMYLSMRVLISNPCYMCIIISQIGEGILLSGFNAFISKAMEYKFSITPGKASLYISPIILLCGGAPLLGGILMKCFDLNVKNTLKLCVGASVLSAVGSLPFLMECEDLPFAGINIQYGEMTSSTQFLGQTNLEAGCNVDCGCRDVAYSPMCGRDGVLYFSPCHAGCRRQLSGTTARHYTNCSCVLYNLTSVDLSPGTDDLSQGELGKCHKPCKWIVLFLVGIGLMGVVVTITRIPILTVILRCITTNERSLGLGFMAIMVKCFGNIPGPILYGKIFDRSCLLWQQSCDGDGACLFYDNQGFSFNVFIVIIICVTFSALAIVVAFICYKVDGTIAVDVCEVEDMVNVDTCSTPTILPITSPCQSFTPTTSLMYMQPL